MAVSRGIRAGKLGTRTAIGKALRAAGRSGEGGRIRVSDPGQNRQAYGGDIGPRQPAHIGPGSQQKGKCWLGLTLAGIVDPADYVGAGAIGVCPAR